MKQRTIVDEPERDVVARWQGGDLSAGEILVRTNFGAIRRFFSSKVNAGLEDLIQETFARCLEHRNRFEGRSSFRSFALGIARNVLFEFYRKKSRRNAMDFGVTSIHALDPSPSQHVAGLQQKAHVVNALRQLPVYLQIAIELRYWENMSMIELSETMECPVGTVKTRLHKGRLKLQEILGDESLQLG